MSLRGETAINACGELCTPNLRAERSPTARYRQRVPVPCAGTEHPSPSLNGHQATPSPASVAGSSSPGCRPRWGICNARSGYVAAAARIMK